MGYLLVGAGGHARVVQEILAARGQTVVAYAELAEQKWLAAPRVDEAEWGARNPGAAFAMGLGGVKSDALLRRLELLRRITLLGLQPLQAIHPAAVVSPSAGLGEGVTVMAGAVVQAHATLGQGVIVNSLALVEHDTVVGDGSHVAPGAMVLGGAVVGRHCMIGAGALVLPGSEIPDGTLVTALTRRPA